MTEPLDTVMDHLRSIKRQTLAAAGDLEQKRRLVDSYFAVDPSAAEYDADHLPASADGVECEWVIPSNAEPGCRGLYIHGGSWVAGEPEKYRPHVARIAQAARCTMLSIAYRLAPEHPFPAGLEDCVRAFNWLRRHSPTGEAPATRLVVIGDSAGGNLTLATLLALKQRGHSQPDAAVVLSPATDLLGTGASMQEKRDVDPVIIAEAMPLLARVYVQDGTDLADPLVSPLYGDLQGLPPLLIQTGEAEVLLDDSVRIAGRLREAGVEVELQVWPAMPHVFQGFAPFLPQANEALADIGKFLSRHLHDHDGS